MLLLQVVICTIPIWTNRCVHTWYVSWHFTSHGVPRLVGSMSRGIPHLMLLHVSWKWRFPQQLFEFYTRISACNHAWTPTREWSYTWVVPYNGIITMFKHQRVAKCCPHVYLEPIILVFHCLRLDNWCVVVDAVNLRMFLAFLVYKE